MIYKDIFIDDYHNLSTTYGSYHVTGDMGEWWLHNNKYHRIDGPAYILNVGEVRWYINGFEFDNTRDYQIKSGMCDGDVIAMVLKYGEVRKRIVKW